MDPINYLRYKMLRIEVSFKLKAHACWQFIKSLSYYL